MRQRVPEIEARVVERTSSLRSTRQDGGIREQDSAGPCHRRGIPYRAQLDGRRLLPQCFGQCPPGRYQGTAVRERRHRAGAPRADAIGIRLHQAITGSNVL